MISYLIFDTDFVLSADLGNHFQLQNLNRKRKLVWVEFSGVQVKQKTAKISKR